jgi:hypothetical protein
VNQVRLVCGALLLTAATSIWAFKTIEATEWQGSPPSQSSRLDDVIAEQISVIIPPPICAVPAWAARVAQAVGMPAGIENAPDACTRAAPPKVAPNAQRLNLAGRTAREALDQLMTLDARYRWVESGGVIIVRPDAAWQNASHFLHRTAPSFDLDAQNVGDALDAVWAALGAALIRSPGQIMGRTPQSSQPIAIHLETATSAYDVLNSIVRTHGAMRWRVTYCGFGAREEFATIGMETYDGASLSSHRAVRKDANGKLFDACRPQR